MNANPKFLVRHRHGGRGRHRAAAQFAQDLRRGQPPRHPRADARDQPVRHAGVVRRRSRIRRSTSTTPPARTPTRTSQIDIRSGLRRAAPAVDRRARRHRRTAGPDLATTAARAWPTRSWPSCASTCTASRAAPRPARTSRRCTTRARASSRRKWNSSPSARTCAARSTWRAESVRPDGRAPGRPDGPPASGPVLRRQHPGRDHAGIRARAKSPAAAPSSRPTSTTRKSSR